MSRIKLLNRKEHKTYEKGISITFSISGDADGVDAEMEHGFNRSALVIIDSTITMKDMIGRGITAENGAVVISNSTVTMSNVQEATIDVRNNENIDIEIVEKKDKKKKDFRGIILFVVFFALGAAGAYFGTKYFVEQRQEETKKGDPVVEQIDITDKSEYQDY